MEETPIPTLEPKPVQPLETETGAAPVISEAKEGEEFGNLLETLGMVVDTEVALDQAKGQQRDVADIMKDVLASAEQKLAAAKAAREG